MTNNKAEAAAVNPSVVPPMVSDPSESLLAYVVGLIFAVIFDKSIRSSSEAAAAVNNFLLCGPLIKTTKEFEDILLKMHGEAEKADLNLFLLARDEAYKLWERDLTKRNTGIDIYICAVTFGYYRARVPFEVGYPLLLRAVHAGFPTEACLPPWLRALWQAAQARLRREAEAREAGEAQAARNREMSQTVDEVAKRRKHRQQADEEKRRQAKAAAAVPFVEPDDDPEEPTGPRM